MSMFGSLRSSQQLSKSASVFAEEGKQCFQGLSRLLPNIGTEMLTARNTLSLCFQSSHKAGEALRQVTLHCFSSLQSFPSLGSLQTIPGRPHNLLQDPPDGFSCRDYREFSSKPILALYAIHYCVTGLQGLHQLSKQSVRDIYYVSKEAGELMKRLIAARDTGSTESILKAIDELRSSPYAYEAGSERIPELCKKLEEWNPPRDVSGLEPTELKNMLDGFIQTVESYVTRVRSLINHDFLVLELHDVLSEDKIEKHFILAEKLADPPGVHIEREPRFIERFQNRGAVLFTKRCGADKRFDLPSLEKILLDAEMDYRLADSCCWDYAVKTSRALLRACADLPSTSIEEKRRLQTEEKDVRAQCSYNSLMGFLNKVMRGEK